MYRLRNLVAAFVLCAFGADAQWSTGQNTTGGAQHLGTSFDTVYVDAAKFKAVLPDTTISTNASGSKIIVGDLSDPATMWDLSEFRAAERNRSDIRAGGTPFPTRYAITITTGQDSVVIWDRDDWSRWMVFAAPAGNANMTMVTVGDIAFLDGILYATSAGGGGSSRIDFVKDEAYRDHTNGLYLHNDDINTRNSGNSWRLVATATGDKIVNATVNAVDAIRDPFGLPMADGSGRTAHWWWVGTDGGESLYNPHTNAIYDANTTTTDPLAGILTPRGGKIAMIEGASQDHIDYRQSILSVTADSWDSDSPGTRWRNDQTGSADLAWANPENAKGIGYIECGSAAGECADKIVVGGDARGMYVLHDQPSGNTEGGKTLLGNGGENVPYEVGDNIAAYHMDEVTVTDFSANALGSMTTGGTPAVTSSGVFGKAITYDGSTDYYTEVNSAFHDPRSVSLWFKSTSGTNPAGTEFAFRLNDEVGATDDYLRVFFDTDGHINASVGDGSSADQASGATDVYDGNWHHIAVVIRASSIDLNLDGELHAQVTSPTITIGNVDTDTLAIGAACASACTGGSNFFAGDIDHVAISKSELTADEIRGMYHDGLKALQSSVDPNDGAHSADHDYVSCIPGWCVSGDEDSTTVWQVGATTLIPAARYGTPNGTIQDAAIWMEPGADSVSVFLATTTRLQAIQPDPNLASAAAHRWAYVQPVIGSPAIVDSAGHGDFWVWQDAIDAAGNAGVGAVYGLRGTYNDPITDCGDSLDISGVGRRTLLTNVNSTGNEALDCTGAKVVVHDMAFSTEAGGGGGGSSAVNWASSRGTFQDNWIVDSDAHGVVIASSFSHVRRNTFTGGDNAGIRCSSSGYSIISGNLIENGWGADGINTLTGCDEWNIHGNTIRESVTIDAGSNNGIIDGNFVEGTLTDNGTGNTVGDNE